MNWLGSARTQSIAIEAIKPEIVSVVMTRATDILTSSARLLYLLQVLTLNCYKRTF